MKIFEEMHLRNMKIADGCTQEQDRALKGRHAEK